MINTLAMCGLLYGMIATNPEIPVETRDKAEARMHIISTIVYAEDYAKQVLLEVERIVAETVNNPTKFVEKSYEVADTCNALSAPNEVPGI